MNATRLRNKRVNYPFYGHTYETLTQIQRKRIVHQSSKKALFYYYPTKNDENGE